MADDFIRRENAIRKAKMANHDTNRGYVDWEQDERTELYINEIPAADVVEVVRCKDCKLIDDEKCLWWNYIPPRDDWFCADGERREVENEFIDTLSNSEAALAKED